MYQGYFFTFEGIDGSGKSTQVEMLKDYLVKVQGLDSILTREIGGTRYGDELKKVIMKYDAEHFASGNKISNFTEVMAIMSARSNHIQKVILPNIYAGRVVICDRFVDSTAAYQSCDGTITADMIYRMHDSVFGLWPDLTFLLELNVEVSKKRLTLRKKNDSYDNKNKKYKELLIEKYRYAASKYPRIIRIDASKSIAQVHEEVVKHVKKSMFVILD